MKIYVLSAGVSQQQDYIWQTNETGQKHVNEPILVKNFKSLLDTQAPSIFIGRDIKHESNQLILFVTGMKASKRKDYRGRTIRNSIALIAEDNPENEQKIRGIAVLALKGELENKIDSAIKEGGEWGFEVDYQEIDNTIKASAQPNNPNTVTKVLMIGKNSQENRTNIAKQLQENCLPTITNDSGALVLVTGIKTEDALKNAGVWRGLSNLVEKEKLTPYDPPNSSQKFFPNIEVNGKANAKLPIKLIIFLGVIGIILLYVFSQILFNPLTHIVQKPSKPNTVFLSSISPGGEYIASANLDGQLLVQNIPKENKDIIENNTPVKSIAISPNGRYVVTGKQDGQVQLWNVSKKKEVKVQFTDDYKKDKTEVLALDFNVSKEENRDTLKIVSGHADGKVLIWQINVENDKGEGGIEELGQ